MFSYKKTRKHLMDERDSSNLNTGQKKIMHEIHASRYGLEKVLRVGWDQYWRNFGSILAIFLIVYIPINIGLVLFPFEELIESQGVSGGLRGYVRLVQLTEFLIGVLATMALAVLIEASLLSRPITWKQAMRQSLTQWGASIWTSLLAGLIILGMALLLIVPGIIWSGYYSLAIYGVALRGLSGKQALDYSKSIVKGQWWRVICYLFVINFLGVLAGILVVLPFFFTDHWLIDILSDTLIDLSSALFLTMTTVFFLNNDQEQIRKESRTGLSPELPANSMV